MGLVLGHLDAGLTSDKDGHREYNVTWLVANDSTIDGPQGASFALGLPQIGDPWLLGSDYDPWAFCWPNWTIRPVTTREPGVLYTVEQVFSTKPLKRCQDTPIEDPLLEPMKISGSWITRRRRIAKDRNGVVIRNGAHEPLKVEVDKPFPTVTISLNTATNLLPLFAPMMGTLNEVDLWDLGPRRVKMAGGQWSRVLYGTCNYYYTNTLEFEVDDSAEGKLFDVEAGNVGAMCLLGHSLGTMYTDSDGNPMPLDPDALDPDGVEYYKSAKWFEKYRDRSGAVCEVLLTAKGIPLPVGEDPAPIVVEHCDESDFALLGIPTTL